MPAFLASREEFNPGPVTKLDLSEVLCYKLLFKSIKDIEQAADIDIRRGKKEYPLLVFSQMLYSH